MIKATRERTNSRIVVDDGETYISLYLSLQPSGRVYTYSRYEFNRYDSYEDEIHETRRMLNQYGSRSINFNDELYKVWSEACNELREKCVYYWDEKYLPGSDFTGSVHCQ